MNISHSPIATLSAPNEQLARALDGLWTRPPGFVGWFCSTNHKDIGCRYIVTAFIFFGLAGILALLMRIQLAFPENHFLGPDVYNQFFTVHGTTMMFLFAVPIMEGLALYFVPLMVGTRNAAFPRLNAFGYYTFLAGGLLLWGGLLLNAGADAGWFAYTPLSGPDFSPGHRVDIWADMITLTEISALAGAVVTLTTVFKQRAPGMSLNRIPLFVWAQVVTSFMIIFAMPAVMLVTAYLAMDRLAHVNTHFFNPAEGGDSLLYQHLFWFFGHPEVYIIFIPATGIVSMIVETFSGRRVFGYPVMVLSLIATAFIGFGLWVHHMFATPIPLLGRSFFSAASMMIAIPSGIQIFCWIITLWTGRPRLQVPLLFVCGFILLFVLGGLTGVMLASVPLDLQMHDTYFVVAHFHYIMVGGTVMAYLGGIHFWWPKMTGRMYPELWGKLSALVVFVGFNLTFFPQFLLGYLGMPRRYYEYSPEFQVLNVMSTAGASILAVGYVLPLAYLLLSLRHPADAGPNPWRATGLEWQTDSPPPVHNFEETPVVTIGPYAYSPEESENAHGDIDNRTR
jgi:cytochrome c oxidase subunit I+III